MTRNALLGSLRYGLAALAAFLVGSASMTPAFGQAMVSSSSGLLAVETVARGLDHPWGLAFLPDGKMLVTERVGRLRIVETNGALSTPLAGVPEVYAAGQGGLLDVALDPDFAANRFVYLSFSEPGPGGASTALGRGRLDGKALAGFQVIFSQKPKVSGRNHFGGRIVFAPDGRLFLTTGERFQFDPAQDLKTHLGKVIRIERDGRVPADNPFVGRSDALPEIWSYGHRNMQAAAMRPGTNELWTGEMGPRGGDEINLTQPGRNYGWPVVSWGQHYNGTPIPDPTTRPDLVPPALYWTPVISPAGMVFYQGNLFPAWKGSMLLGGLTTGEIVRVVLNGTEARDAERITMGVRIRDVAEAPDGSVFALTDESNGRVLRLRPQAR